MSTPTNIRYVAEPKHVREVSLIGAGDLGFWSAYLKAEGLAPVRWNDAAQVLIMAAEMAYLGIRFTEVSVSVRVALAGEGAREGVRLLHAFTSSRVFSWCERTFFAMPHTWAECQVSRETPLSFHVRTSVGCAIGVEMSPTARGSLREGGENWEGPGFLPLRGMAGGGRLFFIRVRGRAVAYPFLSGDCVSIDGSIGGGVLRPLVDSGFSPKEWVVRADATHARSRTYRRTKGLAQ